MAENEWCEEAKRSRAGWRMTYRHGLEKCERERVVQASEAVRDVVCEVCSRKFRQEGDKKRDKCVAESRKPCVGAAQSRAVWRMSCLVSKQRRTGCLQMQTRDLMPPEEIKVLSLLPYGQAWPFNGSWLTGQGGGEPSCMYYYDHSL